MLNLIKNIIKLLFGRLPYILFLAFCLYGTVYVVQLSFYRFMPPSYFLNVKSSTIDSSQVNQPLNLSFCRYARETYSNSEALRSYYLLEGHKKMNAGQYPLTVNYEKGDICQIVTIPPEKHPRKSGVYEMQTSIKFIVKFDDYKFEKVLDYGTDDTFRLSDTVEGLQQQIIELQQEIESLKQILRNRGVEVPETTPAAVVVTQNSTATSFQPTTSEPPDETANVPLTPTTPNESPILTARPLLNFVQNTANNTITGVTQLVDGTLKVVGL